MHNLSYHHFSITSNTLLLVLLISSCNNNLVWLLELTHREVYIYICHMDVIYWLADFRLPHSITFPSWRIGPILEFDCRRWGKKHFPNTLLGVYLSPVLHLLGCGWLTISLTLLTRKFITQVGPHNQTLLVHRGNLSGSWRSVPPTSGLWSSYIFCGYMASNEVRIFLLKIASTG